MDDVLLRLTGNVGHITLNRPSALNALTHDMALLIEKALVEWAKNDHVKIIIIDSVGDKAFCAGGDIQWLYERGLAGDFEATQKFWADEYRLDALIARYPKPFVSFMSGIVMGGGVGISAHASHRIVSDNTMLAMPECGIGLIPDVGGSYILAKAPGYLGEYVGLSGLRMGAADSIYMGFADHYVPQDLLIVLKEALLLTGDIDVVGDFTKAPSTSPIAGNADNISKIFNEDNKTVGDIIFALEQSSAEWAVKAAKSMRRASPLSLGCSLNSMRQARDFDRMEQSLSVEYRFVARCLEFGDFREGIRAQIIDKDRTPKWSHSSVELLREGDVGKMMADLGNLELNL